MKRMKGLSRKIAVAAREQRGVTLIEATIGLALLGILGVIFLSAISTSTITMSVAEEKVNMNNLARAQMEYTKNSSYIAYIYGTPDVPPDYARVDDPNNPDAIVVPSGYSIDVAAQALHQPDDGIQEITVTASRDGESLVLKGYKVNR